MEIYKIMNFMWGHFRLVLKDWLKSLFLTENYNMTWEDLEIVPKMYGFLLWYLYDAFLPFWRLTAPVLIYNYIEKTDQDILQISPFVFRIRESYRIGMTWWWVNDDIIFIFGWTKSIIFFNVTPNHILKGSSCCLYLRGHKQHRAAVKA